MRILGHNVQLTAGWPVEGNNSEFSSFRHEIKPKKGEYHYVSYRQLIINV